MSNTKVTLRKRLLPSGKITLYLDFYPPVLDPRTQRYSRREYLGIYLVKNPRTMIERDSNKEKLAFAEGIRAQREIAILTGKHGFIDKTVGKMDFTAYFKDQLATRDRKYKPVYDHLTHFTGGTIKVEDVTVEFCNRFRDHLLNTNMISRPEQPLSHNTAVAYWSMFRSILAQAVKEHIIQEDINKELEPLEHHATQRGYLTLEELRRLAATPCPNRTLHDASIFSCLTGLRISDIRNLRWENFQTYPDGGRCIQITTQKTKTVSNIPISEDAYHICGTPAASGNVFPGLSNYVVTEQLQKWLKSAGITKHITFHCFRHTNATILLNEGVDIYTVSKMLTHSSVSTTQIYAKVLDKSKRQAAETIKIYTDTPETDK